MVTTVTYHVGSATVTKHLAFVQVTVFTAGMARPVTSNVIVIVTVLATCILVRVPANA